jgi:hypothetical protein
MGVPLMIKIVVAMFATVILSGCVSKVTNPVTSDLRSEYSIDFVTATLPQKKLPDRYDVSATAHIKSKEFSRFRNDFDAFAEERGGLTQTNSSELFLQYIIKSGVKDIAAPIFTGERAATLSIDVQGTTFPNAATMLLVGEVIGISYMLTLSDDATGTKIIETQTKLSPYVDPSWGSGGGLLGMALRSGGDRHIKDLENLAIAVSTQVNAILGATEINEPVAKTLVLRVAPAIPAAQETAPAVEDEGDLDRALVNQTSAG